ncbi:sigma-54 interaction domain-containing protein [Spirochaeta isovalerica]|uniref:Transcriptional regulator with PAS, ATPase and Fis domain n=1 Tax=Spirochaeta isovalerica TaxID=150 RepID=A0A841RF06_9SPIO|nr:sigma 54-interacting transcriptional regulator [Spirochaeta isovalerica]MBB6482665.1 transcriptional regulator with PAS, ATPase and Fis domain [Spirochaeta isovalerica]
MKSIAIVTDSIIKGKRLSNLGEIVKANILDVFGSNVLVKNYFIDTLTPESMIKEDIIVIMASSRASKVRRYTSHPENIIVAKRTFSKKSIAPLYDIPEGSDVLIVNDDIETVLESISSLYHIGIKNVNLIPFISGKDYNHIKYAVSPSEPELIPENIENVFDVGHRVLDISTMLLIINTLKIDDKKTQQNLYNYYQEIFSSNEGIVQNYNSLLARTEELDQLLDLSHDGILLTDKEGKILIYNKKFKEIFDLKGKLRDQNIGEILKEIDPAIYSENDFHDDLIHFKKKIINLEKRNVIHFNKEERMYFSFQEVTHIKKLEQNLSRKLRQKGHVARYSLNDIVTTSSEMKNIVQKAKKIAQTDLTVLITGESGTGKEILAQAIHNASPRKNQPFIAVNSAAIPESLIESELFGYESGSFTGALKEGKPGLFEKAHNGTIFLDEIGDMPNHLQSKLLRVLQERQIVPVGSDRVIDIDIRVIAATHKSPTEMIESGSFRKDLFYRLNVFPLELPSLSERVQDIPPLLKRFTGNRFLFSPECIDLLKNHNWPGNIRELYNIAQYISTFEERDIVDIDSLPRYMKNQFQISKKSRDKFSRSNELLVLGEMTDPELSFAVLKAIDLLNSIGKTAGRNHIIQLMKQEDYSIGESLLRRILAQLQSLDFIIIKKGRSGCYLTEKGALHLSSQQIQVEI